MPVLGDNIWTFPKRKVGCDIKGILCVSRTALEKEMTPMEREQWLRTGGFKLINSNF